MGSMDSTELLALKKHVQRLAKDIDLIPKIAYEGLRSQVEDSCRESLASLPKSMIRKCTEKIFNDLRRFLHLNSSDETSVISILSQDSAMKIGNNLLNITVLVEKMSNVFCHNKVTPKISDSEKSELVILTPNKKLFPSENNNNAPTCEEPLDGLMQNETKKKITVNCDSNGEVILNLTEIPEIPEVHIEMSCNDSVFKKELSEITFKNEKGTTDSVIEDVSGSENVFKESENEVVVEGDQLECKPDVCVTYPETALSGRGITHEKENAELQKNSEPGLNTKFNRTEVSVETEDMTAKSRMEEFHSSGNVFKEIEDKGALDCLGDVTNRNESAELQDNSETEHSGNCDMNNISVETEDVTAKSGMEELHVSENVFKEIKNEVADDCLSEVNDEKVSTVEDDSEPQHAKCKMTDISVEAEDMAAKSGMKEPLHGCGNLFNEIEEEVAVDCLSDTHELPDSADYDMTEISVENANMTAKSGLEELHGPENVSNEFEKGHVADELETQKSELEDVTMADPIPASLFDSKGLLGSTHRDKKFEMECAELQDGFDPEGCDTKGKHGKKRKTTDDNETLNPNLKKDVFADCWQILKEMLPPDKRTKTVKATVKSVNGENVAQDKTNNLEFKVDCLPSETFEDDQSFNSDYVPNDHKSDLWTEEAKANGFKPQKGHESGWLEIVFDGLQPDSAVPDTSDYFFNTKRQRLIKLLDWLCTLFNSSDPLPEDFHPLRKMPAEYYGLTPYVSKKRGDPKDDMSTLINAFQGCWKQELMLLLMTCPDFPSDDRSHYGRIFGLNLAQVISIFSNYLGILDGKLGKQHFYKFSGRKFHTTAISRELLIFGFRPFSKIDPKTTESFKNNKSDKIILPYRYASDKPEMGGAVSLDCVEWISQRKNKVIQVGQICPPFKASDWIQPGLRIMRDMKIEQAFALVGLKVDRNKPDMVKGKVLVECSKSPSHDIQRDLNNWIIFLEENLGLSQVDIFKRPCDFLDKVPKHLWDNDRAPHRFNQLPIEVRASRGAEFQATYDKLSQRGTPTEIENTIESIESTAYTKNYPKSDLQIHLDEDMEVSQINSVAVLMGRNKESLKLREILTQELVHNCSNGIAHNKGGNKNPHGEKDTYSNKKLAKTMFDLFQYFAGFKKSCEIYPYCKDKVDKVLDSWKNVLILQKAQREKRVCTYCGKNEDDFEIPWSDHIKDCQYEQKSCNCDVTFKSPLDKKRHMKLYHSAYKYIKCEDCNVIFREGPKAEMLMQNHIKEIHKSDEQILCEVCNNSFENINRLRAHRLSHESYFCQLCDKEVVGRNVFRAHELKLHNSGFQCSVCDKSINTKRALGIHMKKYHSDTWKN